MCILFSGPQGSDLWTTSGYNNWRNGARDVSRHEVSQEHRDAEIARIKWKRGMTVDNFIEKNKKDVIQENRKVMLCVLDCVRYLSEEMMAFRGKKTDDGKFLNQFRTMSKHDPSAAAYLMKVDESHRSQKKMAVNLISSNNVRIVVKTIKQMIVEKIVTICG